MLSEDLRGCTHLPYWLSEKSVYAGPFSVGNQHCRISSPSCLSLLPPQIQTSYKIAAPKFQYTKGEPTFPIKMSAHSIQGYHEIYNYQTPFQQQQNTTKLQR